MKKLICAVLSLIAVRSLSAATECVWIGGESGDPFVETNWDPHVVPSDSSTPYIAVFTNSVTIAKQEKYWYLAGFRVRNNATVVNSIYRCTPCSNCEDDVFLVDVEEGSSLTLKGVIFYGAPNLTLRKQGGGTFYPDMWCGNSNTGKWYNKIEIFGGVFQLMGSDGRVCVSNEVRVASGGTLLYNTAASQQINSQNTSFTAPRIVVDEGGVIDLNGKQPNWASLSGTGVITNCTKAFTLTLIHSGEVFSGRIFGGAALTVEPSVDYAPDNATCVIGSADTLADATVLTKTVEGKTGEIRFADGIGTVFVKTIPADRPYYHLDGTLVTFQVPGNSWYVDCNRTGAPGDGKSPETAFQTLAEASTNAALADYDTIFVAPGVYSNGAVEVVQNNITTLNRVKVPANVRLVATGSAADTFIIGASSPTPVDGCYGNGPGAVRCAYLSDGASLRGFTICGGRTYCTAKSAPTIAQALGGGVYAAKAATCIVVDCVISNNVAVRGGGGQMGTYIRCRFTDNAGTQIGAHLMDQCNAYNCFFGDAVYSYHWYVAGTPSKIVNCTFGPNGSGALRCTATTEAKRAHAYNSIFLSAPLGDDVSCYHNCLIGRRGTATGVGIDEDCVVTNLTDAAELLEFAGLSADFRPIVASGPAVGTGRADYYADNFPVVCFAESTSDLDGRARFRDGNLDLGAFQFDPTVTYVRVSVAANGMTVEGIEPGKLVSLAAGETLTYTLKRTFDSATLCTGFTVNGVFYDFDDYPTGWTHTVNGIGYTANELVAAVYADKTSRWYVDPERGNDSNPGYHRLCPKKNVAETMSAAKSGDTVYALPGWFSNELAVAKATETQTNRVVVKSGVVFEALEGPDKTFIVGAPSPEPLAECEGCGPGAIRCVYLNANSILRGFTLTNGYTVSTAKTKGETGGGVLASSGAVTEYCVIRNCTGVRGGGASGGTCRNCRFYANSACYIGEGANSCQLYNCLFDNHGDGYVTLYCVPVVNCTFLPGNSGNVVHYNTPPDNPMNVRNCIVMSHARNAADYTRCVFSSDAKGCDEDKKGEGAITISRAEWEAMSDADGRLKAGCPLIDMGWSELYEETDGGASDLDGSQRVYNAKLDIGAFEYDWRGDFAKRIGKSRKFAVTEASPAVTTNGLGQVKLTDGTSLAAEWTNVPDLGCRYAATVQVFGEGALTVKFDGEPVGSPITATDDPVIVSMTADEGEAKHRFDFSFTGAGHAVVGGFSGPSAGLLLLVR